jgi:hypothetical protein
MRPLVNPQLETVMSRVLDNLKAIKYGDVSVTFKVHDSRIVSVTHTVTESTRQPISADGTDRKTGPPGP